MSNYRMEDRISIMRLALNVVETNVKASNLENSRTKVDTSAVISKVEKVEVKEVITIYNQLLETIIKS